MEFEDLFDLYNYDKNHRFHHQKYVFWLEHRKQKSIKERKKYDLLSLSKNYSQ